MTKKTLKGHFCWFCGSDKRITFHHLKVAHTRKKKKREDMGIILYNGEVIPLCRPCHDDVERAKVYINSMKSRKAAYNIGYEQGVLDSQNSNIAKHLNTSVSKK